MSAIGSKKSSNQIDQAPYLFGVSSDPKALTIDPSAIRLVTGSIKSVSATIGSGTSQFFSSEFSVEGEEEPEESIANLLPKLEDISIKSMVLDYTTTPVSVKLILRVKNSTGYTVKGISGRVPNK